MCAEDVIFYLQMLVVNFLAVCGANCLRRDRYASIYVLKNNWFVDCLWENVMIS